MNFIAIIGIVDQLTASVYNGFTTLKLKVEKPAIEAHDEDYYDVIDILVDVESFKNELDTITNGTVVGIKGRAKLINNNMQLISERLQVF
ncbi:MAG: hypothetical protein LBT77_01120 [Mycoplasmataceae bacterium]|jgi:hypothetical protein|nr:hypothetical protein [Mycoplasmataceae bacterium]